MLRKNFTKVCAILFLCALLVSCGRVKIKDKEVCGDLGTDGADCFHTLKDTQRYIPKLEWDELRFGWLCMSPESFAQMKTEILQLCETSGKCNYEKVEKLLTRFSLNLNRINLRARKF